MNAKCQVAIYNSSNVMANVTVWWSMSSMTLMDDLDHGMSPLKMLAFLATHSCEIWMCAVTDSKVMVDLKW